MSNYETEEEQVAAIKEWWKQNGTACLVGVAVGLAILFGWKAWQDYKKRIIAESSIQYTLVLEHLQEKRYEEVVSNANLVIEDYSKSSYAALSSLAKAKAQTELKQTDKAIESTKQAVDIARSDDIKSIARLRLAQLYLSQNNYTDSLSALEAVKIKEFIPQADLIKGDVYLAQGDTSAAINAYKKALDAELSQQLRVIAKLKYENLAGKYEPSS